MPREGPQINLFLIAFVLGAGLFLVLPHLPHTLWFVSLVLAPLCWRYPCMRPWIFLQAGFHWTFLQALLQLSPGLPPELEGKDVVVTGVIDEMPLRSESVTRFEMRLTSLRLGAEQMKVPKRIRLSWYGAMSIPEPGESWQLRVRLKRPHGYRNPGGFDYERWLFSRGIQATGSVREDEGNRRIGSDKRGGWLDRLRMGIGSNIEHTIEDPRAAALVRALTIGDRSGLSAGDWDSFSRTGASHLVAISGLHIGMVAGLIYLLGQWLWRSSERLTLRLPAQRAGAWLALVAALCYAALAGFSLPTQRALLMLGLGLGALLIGRELSLSRSFCLALFGVVLLDPFVLLSAGFWLSFGAVAVILYAMNGRLARARGVRQWARVQWVVMGLAPLLFIHFNQVSLVAPLVNLILVPWFTFLLVPLLLVFTSLLAASAAPLWTSSLVEYLASMTLWCLDGFAHLPHAVLVRPDLPLWVWLAAFAGVAILLAPKGMPGRYLGWVFLAPMLITQPARLPAGSILLTLLDVGQGLSAVIETRNRVLVYDTGPAFPSGFNTAEAVLIPYLRSRGIQSVDRLIVSNADRDHAGGVAWLLKQMTVLNVSAGEPLAGVSANPCRMGEIWEWDGVSFEILHPDPGDEFNKSNDRSCVLKVSVDGRSVLLPGDLEADAERALVQRHGEALRADILIAPHHGSRTSSTAVFVKRVRPAYVLFAIGYRNRFGFPKPTVMKRWHDAGAITLDTVDAGAIQFLINPGDSALAPLAYRRENTHIWSTSVKGDE